MLRPAAFVVAASTTYFLFQGVEKVKEHNYIIFHDHNFEAGPAGYWLFPHPKLHQRQFTRWALDSPHLIDRFPEQCVPGLSLRLLSFQRQALLSHVVNREDIREELE